jgi:iron complex outermembrane recepter protein
MKLTHPPFPLKPQYALLGLLLLTLPFAIAANDKPTKASDSKTEQLPEMTVEDKLSKETSAVTSKERYKVPSTTESVTHENIDNTINAMNAEDTIKYLPSIQVRKRYVGDTNAPVGWRTSGTGLSARGLIYADGIMLSSLLGNNNGNTGSPRWNMVSPNEIERVDVMYGPFSAMYSGNSIGGVVEMTTKMPQKFEAGADIKSSWQTYSMYDKNKTYDSQEYSFNLGDRMKDFSWRFDVSHLDSHSQPITYLNPIATPASTISAANGRNTPTVLGAINNANPFNVPAQVLGEGNLNHTVQDNFKWKLAYDITPTIRASYTLGLWQNDGRAGFNSFLTNAATGLPLDYSPTGFVRVQSNGQYYPLAANGFSETRAEQLHWSHGMNIKSNTGGIFDWDLSGSVVDYGKDISRVSTQSPALASTNGAGQVTSLTGTGWHTADAKGIWRPHFYGQHEVSFGFHHEFYNLNNPVYNVASNWAGANSSLILNSNSKGKTQTEGYWLQDAWDFHKDWNLTLGGRLESWHAFDGYNASNLGARNATANIPLTNSGLKQIYQADKSEFHFSPKFKLTWQPMEQLKIGASVARAFRFPTVTELFQTSTVTVGGVQNIINGNPNLKPEDALSSELATEYFLDKGQFWDKGKLRLSLFQERINNAIYSQNTILPTGAVTSTPSNVGQTQTYGIEFSGEANDVGIQGLDISGNATWTDSRITKNEAADLASLKAGPTASNPLAFAPSEGARQPRVPEWRASATIGYRPTDKWNNSVSMRYSSRQFSQLNNTDTNGGTYTGNTGFFVVDLHSKYQITKQLAIAGGIDNINNAKYWIFHPFPMRTYFAELKFNY